MDSSNHLYIIGNGFDLHHGARSSYKDFYDYLLRVDCDIIKDFYLYFGPKSLINSFNSEKELLWCLEDSHRNKRPSDVWADKYLWRDFEKYLSYLNREKVLDILDMFLPRKDESDDDFLYADFYCPLDQISGRIYEITELMQRRMHKWIRTLHYKHGYKNQMINIDTNARFLNFNYTPFLESVYGVPHNNINYIHGASTDKIGSLVLGHSADVEKDLETWLYKNKNRRRYRDNLKDRSGRYFGNYHLAYLAYFCENPEEANWLYPVRYYAAEQAVNRIEDYFKYNRKDSLRIINNNRIFFDSLSEISEITVIGHSLGDVDMPYFQEILKSSHNKDALHWTFVVYVEDEKYFDDDENVKNVYKFCRKQDINNFSVYSYNQILRSSIRV